MRSKDRGAPETIDWHKLSFRSREIAAQIGLRLSAGFSTAEVATQLTEARPSLKHHELPKGDVTKHWVAARLRELRQEIEEVGAAR